MLIKRKELRCPKLVLSHIRSDNGVLKAVIDRLQNGLGRKGRGLHAQGMLLLPALKLRQPFPGRKRLCLFQQGGDCAFCIGHNRDIYGNVKGLFDDATKLFASAYRYGIFCNAPCNAHNIHLLKGIVSYQPGGNLPGKAYERDTVIVGSGDSRYKIGGSRPAGYQTYSCFSGRTRIAVRSVYQTLFMAGQDNLGYSGSIQRVE